MIKLKTILTEANKIVTVYHGNKSGTKLSSISFTGHTYLYLTPIYRYALEYAKNNPEAVTELQITVNNLLDLRMFGINPIDSKSFYQKTKLYLPGKLLAANRNAALWELFRLDFNADLKRTFNKYDGAIIQERKNSEIFESYILFNNNPIVN